MEPLISVIIPAYNIEAHIHKCLDSICEQTYANLEIVVVDDGSDDNTGKIIDDMAKKDHRIIPIHKKNGGVSEARNTGLDFVHGSFIGFVDGDDIIERDMYDFLLKNALEHHADISHCGYQMVFPNRVDYYHNTGEIMIQNRSQGVYDLIKADKVEPGLCNKLFKREVIGNIRLDKDIRINEDLLFNYQIFKKAEKSVFADFPKYHYMVRANSASTSRINRNKLEDPLLVIEKIMKQEQGAVLKLLEKRYMYLLEKVSVTTGLENNNELLEIQKKRRNELKSILKTGTMQGQYSKKDLIQLNLAAKTPAIYRIVNDIYARVTGSKNRYKV